MALTPLEAEDRAKKIWGEDRFLKAQPSNDDQWWIQVTPVHIPGSHATPVGNLASNHQHHTLDGNGHAICHTDCETLEASRD